MVCLKIQQLGQVEVLFGEWLWARHSVSYTKLPAYFVAFDIYNKRQGGHPNEGLVLALVSRLMEYPHWMKYRMKYGLYMD
jgi:hypothetical protein